MHLILILCLLVGFSETVKARALDVIENLRMLPVGDCDLCERPRPEDVQYKLYTSSDPNKYETIKYKNFRSLRDSSFDPNNPTVIFLFGFTQDATGPSTTVVKDAFMEAGNFNFIVVDWAPLVNGCLYSVAVKNTLYMGRELAQFVLFLEEAGVPAWAQHVVGFSLGAQAAGRAGKLLKTWGHTLGRITGLDPALPEFSNEHLVKGDAAFVDVIHTNPGLFGFSDAVGDVDFYPNYEPNGVFIQSGCELFPDSSYIEYPGCSHNRAWRFFAESVLNPRGFPASSCSGWQTNRSRCTPVVHGYMGYGANRKMSGIMYLATKDQQPFAIAEGGNL